MRNEIVTALSPASPVETLRAPTRAPRSDTSSSPMQRPYDLSKLSGRGRSITVKSSYRIREWKNWGFESKGFEFFQSPVAHGETPLKVYELRLDNINW